MVTIRKAKLKEVPQIANMGVEMVRYHEKYGEYFKRGKETVKVYQKFFRSCIHAPNKLLLVAEEKGKIIGYSLGWKKKRPSVYNLRDVGYISDVYVKAQYRRKGIGKMFIREMHSWFKSKCLKYSELAVVADNEPSRNAWRKHGFKAFMIQKHQRLR